MKLKQPLNIRFVIGLLALVCVGGFIAGSAWAKEPNEQYTNIAPLPGGGIALNPAGEPDGQGALQINIPVAYTPKWGYASVGAFWGNYPDHDDAFGNGSGVLAVGFFNKPAVYVSVLQVSREWDESGAVNAQVGLLEETASRPAVAVGVQDIFEKEEDMRSVYVVATKQISLFDKQAFASLGYGDGRFLDRPFGGVSVPLNDYFNVALEWDGFQLNSGVAVRPGGRDGWFTILGGFNGRDGWLVGASAAFDFGR